VSELATNRSQALHAIGFLMDPYESLNLKTETSLLCMEELLIRGHRVYWIEQSRISLVNGIVCGQSGWVKSTAPFMLDQMAAMDIKDLDALVIRKDPPFDQSYLHLTYLLDFLPKEVIQINPPAALRNFNEKLFTLNYPDICPHSLVSKELSDLMAFADQFKKIVLKPLNDCSGRGIEFVQANQADLALTIGAMLAEYEYLLAQEFLPGIQNGDKRVYLVNGEPVGWVNRVPKTGSDLANIHQGASCEATELTPVELEICRTVGPDLVKEHILLAGLDFIDERLTEINITSPSAVRQINQFTRDKVEIKIVNAILSKLDIP